MEFDYQIRRLSTDFFNAYPESVFPEILRKEQRPYYCLVVDIHEDFFICIPYRSNLSQKLSNKQGFKFVNSRRSRQSPSGLDYRKIIIVRDLTYIDKPCVIDQDEYKLTLMSIPKIVTGAVEYVERYVKHVSKEQVLHPREYEREYMYSTLPYFHKELGLEENN